MAEKRIRIDHIAVEQRLWEIRCKLQDAYGLYFDEAGQELAPLSWYIGTGRASTEFLRKLMTMGRIKKYLGF